ncbi:lipoprotein [Spiroplasma diminutum]|uniref:Lipoprotein n=1 Tax=Spiroplasma diminutum CUAS-1 TaxID=1276221 RepID=S5MEV9_9MOLU|nr:lipoprotein [Spiroplasma diminutum]AGR42308.1 hypothetical protein SDIMI_v3c06040 [Spiroplasma diminutum CUAS-1]
MRKLLSVISATALVGTSTLTVVSCSSNKYFKEFKKWIDNKESFLLYIGADDCTHCIDFENAKKDNSDKFNEKLMQITTGYNQTIANNENEYPETMTAFGEKLNNEVDFREFKTEELANNFKEKWSKNIISWMVDQVTPIYKDKTYGNTGTNDTVATRLSKKAVEAYFDSSDNKGTPMFILIRNGKLVSWNVGYSKSSEVGHSGVDIEKLFDPIIEDMKYKEIEEKMVTKINNSGSSTGGGEGETSEDTLSFNYALNDQDLINNYYLNK